MTAPTTSNISNAKQELLVLLTTSNWTKRTTAKQLLAALTGGSE